MSDLIAKGTELTLLITDLNNLGCGVGRAPDGRAVFVAGAVAGDTVIVMGAGDVGERFFCGERAHLSAN